MAVRVVGDPTPSVVSEAGRREHPTGLARNGPSRETGSFVPVVGRLALGPGREVQGGRLPPRVDFGSPERLHPCREVRIGQDNDNRAKSLRDLSRRCHDLKAFLDACGCHHHMGRVTVLAEHGGQEVRLFHLGWESGAGTSPLNVHHHQWDLEHHRQPDEFLFEGKPRSGGDREGGFSSVGGTHGHAYRSNFVLGLVDNASELVKDFAEIMRDRRGRCDGVH